MDQYQALAKHKDHRVGRRILSKLLRHIHLPIPKVLQPGLRPTTQSPHSACHPVVMSTQELNLQRRCRFHVSLDTPIGRGTGKSAIVSLQRYDTGSI